MFKIKRLLIFCICLMNSSCMVGPNFKRPLEPDTKCYTEKPLAIKTTSSPGRTGQAQYFALDRDIPGEWWRLFHSKELNCLIEKGLQNSPTIAAAQAALCVAKQNYMVGFGALFPAVSALGTGVRQRFSTQTAFGVDNLPPSVFSLYNVSINVSYVLDVFGGTRRNLEALCALVDYQYFLMEGTYVTLAANIVSTALTEASLREQIKATLEIIQLQEDILNITRKQESLGGVSHADVLNQEAELALNRATLPPLEKSLAQTRHALAALVGEFPSESDLPCFDLNKLRLPRTLPVSLPSNLVQQRPDIRAAEALMHQASAKIGVATANMLPQFILTANYAYQAGQISSLFNSLNNIWSYGGQVMQPLFQGGALISARRAAIATFDQAVAQYKQTVLKAFQNVADTLQALADDARLLQAQTAAETAASQSLKLNRAQFKLGAINYLLLLNAERQYQLARIKRIQAETLRYTDTVALFQALGGGWWEEKCRDRIDIVEDVVCE